MQNLPYCFVTTVDTRHQTVHFLVQCFHVYMGRLATKPPLCVSCQSSFSISFHVLLSFCVTWFLTHSHHEHVLPLGAFSFSFISESSLEFCLHSKNVSMSLFCLFINLSSEVLTSSSNKAEIIENHVLYGHAICQYKCKLHSVEI